MTPRPTVLAPTDEVTPTRSGGVAVPRGPRPAVVKPSSKAKARGEQVALFSFVVVPFVALVAAIPLLWNRGISLTDVVISFVTYAITGHGITIGFHRYFTHGAFKAKRPMRIALAIAGTAAIEGPVIRWVADHRRHHAFSDKEGDPHSPWRYGESFRGLCKGMFHAHMGWLFDEEQTSQERFAPDLLADKDIVRVHKMFTPIVIASLVLPAVAGGLVTWSWYGAATAFFWGSLVRVCVLHHTTWSINSVCHVVGDKPFKSRDRSGNVWPLALISMGESWHNLHHADPTCARHGVLRFQFDSSARLISLFELFGWVYEVRWPSRERIESKRVAAT
jgi:stearoyl-CoA desaturase (delta-9 desaturase)